MNKAGISWVAGVALALTLAVPAQAQELSEKSVKTFMNYAWSLVPQQFTPPNGKTIMIDKKNKDAVIVPVDVAREIIRVGRLSAHAQICDLKEDQILNYRSLMRREQDKKKWSEQQLVYISQLHLTTVMLLTGKIRLVAKKDGQDVVVDEEKEAPAKTCSDEQKTKVKEVIQAYVKAGPNLALNAAPPATAKK